jgi:hypothetical protein
LVTGELHFDCEKLPRVEVTNTELLNRDWMVYLPKVREGTSINCLKNESGLYVVNVSCSHTFSKKIVRSKAPLGSDS